MMNMNLDEVNKYVNENIVDFHQRKVKSLEELSLKKVIKKKSVSLQSKECDHS